MATAKELKAQADAARVAADAKLAEAQALAYQARRAEAAERLAQRAETYADHSKRLFDELGYELTAKQHELIYAKAYDDSHSGGYGEVEGTYSELADLVRQCLGSASYL